MFGQKKNKHQTEVKANKKRETRFRKDCSVQLHPGHILFEMSPDGEVKPCEYLYTLNKTITWEQALKKDYLKRSSKVMYKKKHLYCGALNIENAKKRFAKMIEDGVDIQGMYVNPNPIKL